MNLNDLPPAAREDLYRLLSYGWLPGIIARILTRTHGLALTPREVKMLSRQVAREAKMAEKKQPPPLS